MSDYRRWCVAGGVFVFTIVTYDRRPILGTDVARFCLRKAITNVRRHRPFTILATVLLPDHWHFVVQLPPKDVDYSLRLKRIKEEFTKVWLDAGMSEAVVTRSEKKRGERGIWQSRFWEHAIRDEEDLERCVDYIHWNPRKHKLVRRVRDWPWSTFHRFVEAGQYSLDWGGTEPNTIAGAADFGEPSSYNVVPAVTARSLLRPIQLGIG
jgi:putative transposase